MLQLDYTDDRPMLYNPIKINYISPSMTKKATTIPVTETLGKQMSLQVKLL